MSSNSLSSCNLIYNWLCHLWKFEIAIRPSFVRCLNENTESQNTNSERQDINFDSRDDSGKINANFSMH